MSLWFELVLVAVGVSALAVVLDFAVHALMVFLRRLSGNKTSKIKRIKLARIIPFIIYLIVITLSYFVGEHFAETRLGVALITTASIGVLIVPLTILIEAFNNRNRSIGFIFYINAIIAAFTLPVYGLLGMLAYSFISSGEILPDDAQIETLFVRSTDAPSACSARLRELSARSIVLPDPRESDRDSADLTDYWIDQAVSGILLDFPEVYDCRLSPLQNKPDNLVFTSFVAAYRFACAAYITGVLLVPLAGFFRGRQPTAK